MTAVDYDSTSGKIISILLFCLSAICLSSPQNMLSPSLSLIATELGFNENERDLYIGGYMSICFSVISLPISLLVGLATDLYDRQILLFFTLVIGGLSMILFGLTYSYPILLLLRIISGSCLSSLIPIMFSMMGDIFESKDRNAFSAIVSASIGAGALFGQLFVGYFSNSVGWRLTFIIFGSFSLIISILFKLLIHEPKRGAKEESFQDALSKGLSLPKPTLHEYFLTMTIPTLMFLMLQSVPNTMPWGILSVHLHDFLTNEGQLSMSHATNLIGLFGAGAAFGGLFGGYLGTVLYRAKKSFLPILMGFSAAMAGLLVHNLLAIDLSSPHGLQLAGPLIIFSGALAAINGANMRGVILNVTAPQSRGVALSICHFANCIGRGTGPYVMERWMRYSGSGRRQAVDQFVNLWFLCGFILCLSCSTISKDEEKMKLTLKKYSDDSARKS